jgi:uncharacterized protein
MAELHELTTDECWELAAEGHLARIAWGSASGPVVLPVNYVVHERELWMRTSAYSSMAEEVDDTVIAVEMDAIDPETHVGWSVLFRGSSDVIYHEESVPTQVRVLRAWAEGPRPLWIRLSPATVTGRRLT